MPASAVASFARGFTLPLRAVDVLLSHRGVKRYAALPLLVNVLLYVLIIALFAWLIANWDPAVGAWEFWGGFGAWLAGAINAVIGVLKWLITIPLILIVCYFTFTTLGMVVASPFNDMLSERVERALTEPKEDARLPLRLTMQATLLSLRDSIVILLRQLGCTLLALPFLGIPVIGFLPLVLVTAWFAGSGFVDSAMARNFLRNRHKAPMLQVHRMEILGFGLAMELLFLVPFAGLIMLPVGVTAGAILYCRGDWERWFAERGLEAPPGFAPPRRVGTDQP